MTCYLWLYEFGSEKYCILYTTTVATYNLHPSTVLVQYDRREVSTRELLSCGWIVKTKKVEN